MLPPGESRWVCAARSTKVRKRRDKHTEITDRQKDAGSLHYAHRWTHTIQHVRGKELKTYKDIPRVFIRNQQLADYI